jgi:putative copper resistance protein D
VNDLLILTRVVHFASVLLLTGIFTFFVFVAEPVLVQTPARVQADAAAFRGRLMTLVWSSLAIAAVSGLLWLILAAGNMSGWPLTEVLSQAGILSTVLTRTQFGHDWLLRVVVAAPLVGLAWLKGTFARGRSTIFLDRSILLLSAVVLAAVAGAGHASATAGWAGDANVVSDAIHLLAAGAWLGALVPLALFFREARRGRDAYWIEAARTATVRFSTLGLFSVGTLLATGVVNAWFLVGSIPALVDTEYGRLLSIKVGLFAVMVFVAAINRFRLTPRLSSASRSVDIDRATLGKLQRNAVIEIGFGVAILIIVGILGVTPPGTHNHH